MTMVLPCQEGRGCIAHRHELSGIIKPGFRSIVQWVEQSIDVIAGVASPDCAEPLALCLQDCMKDENQCLKGP